MEIAVHLAFLTWTQHKKTSGFTPIRQYTASVCSSQRTDIYYGDTVLFLVDRQGTLKVLDKVRCTSR
uniref:Uncharacterized protein n=1 Tax=Populus trichocarpa TaxID=3694 RepID=U5FQK3_POPTR